MRNGEPLGQSRSAAERLIADRAHEELRDLIVTLKLAPGALLREDELMAQLGIGRTPLRDAIKRLSLEGLVSVQPRRGTTITPTWCRRSIATSRSPPRSGTWSSIASRGWRARCTARRSCGGADRPRPAPRAAGDARARAGVPA